ncbi:hypothetical protein I3760_08G042500 [Carya illinoinensis]|uniref:Phorbol-ester/DAG-type domain-containing protein n=1 Tax=Carya illinoinensis TaxID=32201 RepID=A0A922J917_CARIL|nr:uncharacterized protein LOC122274172 [Carya illinoinensis]KAG2692229.1 hypothetical protein I3760_08G042500 [Carya illinoinensis]KAG6698900.1 hypothetical protein I3842_08G042400 [Carya illinoinensis]
MEKIEHFSHKHPLTFIESATTLGRKYRNKIKLCAGCDKICTFPLYACTECSFYLHKSCADLLRVFQNPFHPHPLTLLFDAEISLTCGACFKTCSGFYFSCEVCDFYLDIGCAFLIPTVGDQGCKQLQHFTHLHPLTIVERDYDNINRVRCLICWDFCSGLCYGCDPCGIFLHQPCAEFQCPQEIQNFRHPCPLTLRTRVNSFRCQACDTSMLGICYHCERCLFFIDVGCALLTCLESEDRMQIKHFSHKHPLFIRNFDCSDRVYCFACGTNCSGPTYICNQCRFSLHKRCAGFPPKIYNLLHTNHPLTLRLRPTGTDSTQVGYPCDVCYGDCNGLTYMCRPCNFDLHDECTGLVPTIKYEGHKHLLLLVEKIGLGAKCNACDKPCGSWVLRCHRCDFNLHLGCGPLPYAIKHNCHLDSLTLTESPVRDDSDDEFYCDACEEERDPRSPVYYCASCLFVADVLCVISEVGPWLKGEYGDVELRTPQGKLAGKVIAKTQEVKEFLQAEDAQAIKRFKTCSELGQNHEPDDYYHDLLLTWDDLLTPFNDMFEKATARAFEIHGDVGVQKAGGPKPAMTFLYIKNSLTDEESMELNKLLATEERGSSSTNQDPNSSDDKQDGPDILSFFLDEAYIDFEQKIALGPKKSTEFWDIEEEIVNVSDYLVPRSLVPILESLFSKYGDVSADTTLSSGVKMYLFTVLCGTLDSMYNTRVLDISEDLLRNWWKNLKALLSAGFKIQFAFEHLKRVAHAYFGLRLREGVDTTLFQLNRDITESSEQVEKLAKNLELMKLKRERIISEDSEIKSSLVDDCLQKAFKLKWRKAGKGLELNRRH